MLLIICICFVALLAAGLIFLGSCHSNGRRLDEGLRRDGERHA